MIQIGWLLPGELSYNTRYISYNSKFVSCDAVPSNFNLIFGSDAGFRSIFFLDKVYKLCGPDRLVFCQSIRPLLCHFHLQSPQLLPVGALPTIFGPLCVYNLVTLPFL